MNQDRTNTIIRSTRPTARVFLSQEDERLRRATARTGLTPARVVAAGRIRPTVAPRTLHNLRPAGDPLTALAAAVGVLTEAVS